ncbi:hypothetical protein IE81DRAFT_346634 [Ceraceosorus guamensis]|uniref:Uncharacterized protein n=1 Tax=Ceraceosorus guamensis TaxID=1522189 RepID=A0A316W1N8_9BASI|nr:hypothetical protein IE81DRAFT_346634 [Ceraceosorus guamensis]PWN43434.1 hypothetical protein IE81DRAFT_346634 [Ceraceosorus guamensis]
MPPVRVTRETKTSTARASRGNARDKAQTAVTDAWRASYDRHVPERDHNDLQGMREDIIRVVREDWKSRNMGTLNVDGRIKHWLHDPIKIRAFHAMARDSLSFQPAEHACFVENGHGQFYIKTDHRALTGGLLDEHLQKHPGDQRWIELLRGRGSSGTVKYAGAVHRLLESGPQTRNEEDARKAATTTLKTRWLREGWRVYALVDDLPDVDVLGWRQSSSEQDAERFLISLLGPLSANSARGGLHLRYTPPSHLRAAAQDLLSAAQVPNGRPPLSPRNHRIKQLFREHHLAVSPHAPPGPALERAIDMAARSGDSRSVILLKDITQEDLTNTADDYGFLGIGCGQGPERAQRIMTMLDFASEEQVYDGVHRIHNPPASSRRAFIDFWPFSLERTTPALHVVMCLRVLFQLDAKVVRITSSEVLYFMRSNLDEILKEISQTIGTEVAFKVITGILPLSTLPDAICSPAAVLNVRLLREAQNPYFEVTELAGIPRLLKVVLPGWLDRELLVGPAVHEGVLKYSPLLEEPLSHLVYLQSAVYRAAEEAGSGILALFDSSDIKTQLDVQRQRIKSLSKINGLYQKPREPLATTTNTAGTSRDWKRTVGEAASSSRLDQYHSNPLRKLPASLQSKGERREWFASRAEGIAIGPAVGGHNSSIANTQRAGLAPSTSEVRARYASNRAGGGRAAHRDTSASYPTTIRHRPTSIAPPLRLIRPALVDALNAMDANGGLSDGIQTADAQHLARVHDWPASKITQYVQNHYRDDVVTPRRPTVVNNYMSRPPPPTPEVAAAAIRRSEEQVMSMLDSPNPDYELLLDVVASLPSGAFAPGRDWRQPPS